MSTIGKMAASIADAGEAVYSLSSSLREQDLDEVIWNAAQPRRSRSDGHAMRGAVPARGEAHPRERGRCPPRPTHARGERAPDERTRSVAEARLHRAMRDGDVHSVLVLSREVELERSGHRNAARTDRWSEDDETSDEVDNHTRCQSFGRAHTQQPSRSRSPVQTRAPGDYKHVHGTLWYERAHARVDGPRRGIRAADVSVPCHNSDSTQLEEARLSAGQCGASAALGRGRLYDDSCYEDALCGHEDRCHSMHPYRPLSEPDLGRHERPDRYESAGRVHADRVERATETQHLMAQRVSSTEPYSGTLGRSDCHTSRTRGHANRLAQADEMIHSTAPRSPFGESDSTASGRHGCHTSTEHHHAERLTIVDSNNETTGPSPRLVTRQEPSQYHWRSIEAPPSVNWLAQDLTTDGRSSEALHLMFAMGMHHFVTATQSGRQPCADVKISLLPAATRYSPPSSSPALLEGVVPTAAESRHATQLLQQQKVTVSAVTDPVSATPATQGTETTGPALAAPTSRASGESHANRRAAALQALRTEGKVVRRAGAIRMLTCTQIKQQLALRGSFVAGDATGDKDALRARLVELVTAEVVAREEAEGADGVTSDGEMERLRGLGLGRKRNTTGGRRRRSASFSTSARPRQASDESDGEADVLQGPDIHKVERILDMKVDADGGRQFLIKWQGWSAKWNGAHSHNARVDFSNPQRSPNLANLNTRTRGTHPAL